MYVRVYAPNGEAFDVTRERADRLILQDGWTQSPVQEAEKKPEPATEDKEDETASTEDAEETKPRYTRKKSYSRRKKAD